MDKVKEFVRGNKKLVALLLAAALTFGGIKLAPETVDSIVNAVVEACCSAEEVPVEVTE